MVRVQEIPLKDIRRPLIRQTDPAKVETLIKSIQEIGQVRFVVAESVDKTTK